MSDQSTSSARPVLGNRYELYRRVKRGGMAEVYLARDQLLDRPVAVKVLFPEFATDPAFVERFRREAQSAASLSHAHVVGVHDWGSEHGTYYIVMEFVEGESLADLIAREGPLEPDRAAAIATDIAGALGVAHAKGIVHRDVKPGNVLLNAEGDVKVTDFGIARAVHGPSESLTQTGAVMGTATYLAPEQAQGQPADPRSDLYALGVVLYEMLTGRPPFTGDTPVAIAFKHVREEPVAPRQRNAAVPADLEAICMRALAKDPQQRYASAEELRADLRRVREGRTPLAASAVTSSPTSFAPAGGAVPSAVSSGADVTRALPGQPPSAAPMRFPPQDEPPRRTWLFVLALLGLLAVLALLIFLFARALGGDDDPADLAEVEVPSVIGRQVEEATTALEQLNLVVAAEAVESADVPPGEVIDQDPLGGTVIEEGGTVSLTVSQGLGIGVVPDVVDLDEVAARQALRDEGFIPEVVREVDPDAEEGVVISQDPPGGTELDRGQEVSIVVSMGQELIEVPQLEGATEQAAELALARAGFQDVTVSRVPSDDVDAGDVIRTEPPARSELAADDPVTLIVSTGPELIELRDFTGADAVGARLDLEDDGFEVRIESVRLPFGDDQDGRVLETDPPAGVGLPPGETVTLRVGDAADEPPTTTTSSTTTTTTTTTAPTSTTGGGGGGGGGGGDGGGGGGDDG